LMLPTIRADFAFAENYTYRAGPLLQMPISVFAGKEDDNKAPGQVDGWGKETSGICRITWFEDGHFFINSQREALLKQLDSELSAVLIAAMEKRSTTGDSVRHHGSFLHSSK
jgi:surfactin synthase thioesterase subunit